MDTVTETNLAIALAQEGGIGIIHRNLTPERQRKMVDKVKRSVSVMIPDPITMEPDQKISEALEIMKKYNITGIPITQKKKLVGILTNRDLRFEKNLNKKISSLMTQEDLVTIPEGTPLSKSKEILHDNRIEKLLVVDKKGHLKGLITIKDIEKSEQFPNAAKDKKGRLLVGAALGVTQNPVEHIEDLVRVGLDVLVIDSAHGHSEKVLSTIREIKKSLSKITNHWWQRCHSRGHRSIDKSRCRCSESGNWSWLHLHHTSRERGWRSTNFGSRRMREGSGKEKHPRHFRWRYQTLWRCH